MSANLPSHWKPTKVRTIELLVSEPSTKIGDIAVEVGVSKSTIHLWLKDPEFVEVFYQKYMVSFGSKLPNVLNSMIRDKFCLKDHKLRTQRRNQRKNKN